MQVEVKYDCGTWTGRIAKVSEGKITGTNKIKIKWDVDDYPDNTFDYPDPDGEIMLMVNEDGIAVAEGGIFSLHLQTRIWMRQSMIWKGILWQWKKRNEFMN